MVGGVRWSDIDLDGLRLRQSCENHACHNAAEKHNIFFMKSLLQFMGSIQGVARAALSSL
jgi:hypothetical protein